MADAQQAREALVAALRHEAPYAERDGYDVTARRMIDAADHIVALAAQVSSLTAERETLAVHIAKPSQFGDRKLTYPHADFADCPTCQLATRIVKALGNPSESEPA
jgi:hypothetical protein